MDQQHYPPNVNPNQPPIYNAAYAPVPQNPGMPAPTPYPPGQTTIVMAPAMFGREPAQTTCPNCQTAITTVAAREDTALQQVLCCIMCLLGLWCCSCIPYCMDSMHNTKHTCPKCNTHLGTYKP